MWQWLSGHTLLVKYKHMTFNFYRSLGCLLIHMAENKTTLISHIVIYGGKVTISLRVEYPREWLAIASEAYDKRKQWWLTNCVYIETTKAFLVLRDVKTYTYTSNLGPYLKTFIQRFVTRELKFLKSMGYCRCYREKFSLDHRLRLFLVDLCTIALAAVFLNIV